MTILPAGERKRIYDELMRLKVAEPSISPASAIRHLRGRFPALPSHGTLRNWFHGITAPTTSMNDLQPVPSSDLSFFIGAWLGDGWADEADGGKRLLLKVRSKEFAEEFAVAATKILGKQRLYRVREVNDKNGRWFLVKVTSVQLFEFVSRAFSELVSSLGEHPAAFLRGVATAEGNASVSTRSSGRDALNLTICISNSDFGFLLFCWNQAQALAYHPTSITRGDRPGLARVIAGHPILTTRTEWQFRIARIKEVGRFLGEIGFADNEKQRKSADALELICNDSPDVAVRKWKEKYVKIRGVWRRKEQDSDSISAA